MDYHKHQRRVVHPRKSSRQSANLSLLRRHLKHYKGIEYDKENGEFFDFDSVTEEELDTIIKAGEAEVEFVRAANQSPTGTRRGEEARPYNAHTDGPRNMFAAKGASPRRGAS